MALLVSVIKKLVMLNLFVRPGLELSPYHNNVTNSSSLDPDFFNILPDVVVQNSAYKIIFSLKKIYKHF